MRTKTAIILCLTAALLAGCSKKEPAPAPQAQAPQAQAPQAQADANYGQKAAPLEGLTYVKGSPVAFKDGSVYVVEFWATWCPPCKTSIPHLTEVQKKFKDKGVTVIGITREAIETVKPFVEKMGDSMNYTVAIDTHGKAGKSYMTAYKQNGIPTAFIVDAAGKIAWIGHPMSGMDEALQKAVDQAASQDTFAASK
jgi:thiol-disulfide isomerase/thioredoxin